MKFSTATCLLAACSASCFAVAANAENDDECRLWLAPSTLSTEEKPMLGLFAGINYDENVPVGPAEIGIPLVDFSVAAYRTTPEKDRMVKLLEAFLWSADYAGNNWEGLSANTIAIPGMGMLTNHNASASNVEWNQESVFMREPLGAPEPGVAHPSRGAVSNYYNFTIRSSKRIDAGMELFTDFGFEGQKSGKDNLVDIVKDRFKYEEADDLMNRILDLIRKHSAKMTRNVRKQTLEFLMEDVLGAAAGSHGKELRDLLPAHPGKLQQVRDMGGTLVYRNPGLVKTPKWLHKHGQCLDNLKVGPSTVPEAGRGAFATRAIKRNKVITPAPMLHIPDPNVFNMYNIDIVQDDDGEEVAVPNFDEPIGKQLILNYCFGHAESNMLLFPVSSTVSFINHKPAPEANARLAWSRMPLDDPVNWRILKPIQMLDFSRIGIVMEVVATKDIAPGDEIFIDYGPEWTDAWNSYMKDWGSRSGTESTWPMRAMDLREVYKTEPFKTVTEGGYPEGVDTACFASLVDDQWAGPSSSGDISGDDMFLCDILERTEGGDFGYNYTVMVLSDEEVKVRNVPHFAITIVDKPYQGDTFAEAAFRHWIGLPEMTVPQAWRDKV